jgi:hypothetical protein
MTKKLSLNQISKALMEDMPQAKYPRESEQAAPVKIKGSASGSLSTPSYDKMSKRQRTKPSLPGKMKNRNPSANSGPEAAPSSKRIPASNSQKKGGQVKAPDLKVSVKNSKSAFLDANKVQRSKAEPVKWSASSDSNTNKLIGSVLKGLTQDSVKKITFNVSKPNVEYGIVPTGDTIKCSQSHQMKAVKASMKPVKEGVINGTTTVRVGSRTHVFEAASVSMLSRMAENYANVGQDIQIDVKVGLRESYSDKKFVTSLLEAIHSKILDVDEIHKDKIAESYKRLMELLEGQYIPFHNRSKKEWIKECVAPAYKQAYSDFKKIYEAHMEPFEITMNVKTPHGVEIIDVVTRAINEDVAMHNAMDEIASELGPRARLNHAYIGSKKIVAENADSLLSKALSFDDMPEGFKDAGFGYKDTKRHEPKKPKVDKMKAPSKKRDQGATVYSPKAAPGSNAEKSVDRNGADKRDKAVRSRPAPKKDAGPRFPE